MTFLNNCGPNYYFSLQKSFASVDFDVTINSGVRKSYFSSANFSCFWLLCLRSGLQITFSSACFGTHSSGYKFNGMIFKCPSISSLMDLVKFCINVLYRVFPIKRLCYVDNKYGALTRITKFSKVLEFYLFFGSRSSHDFCSSSFQAVVH